MLRDHERVSRLPVLLAATASLLFCSLAFSQTTATTPASATGAPLPGVPTGPRAPHTATGRIGGRIVDAQTGTPLRRAQVTLGIPASPARSALTDREGRFEFAQLPAGRYAIIASKTGFVTLQYGQRRPTDVTDFIVLADGERRDAIDLALPRGGVISVRLTDDFGEALPGAQVQVQRYQYGPDGQRQLNSVYVPGAMGPNVTDDRGEVRMYGLVPGDYVVSASLRNQGVVVSNLDPLVITDGFATTYHPGTVNPAEAQTVTVSLAEDTAIAFALSTVPLTRVSGTVLDSQGRPAAGSFVSVMTRQGTSMFGSGGGSVSPDGTFTINGVAPGEYSLEVRTEPRLGSTEAGEFGSTSIVVADAELSGVRIVTGKGTTISGRVIFEGTPPRRSDGQPELRVFTNQADPSRPSMVGTFTLDPRSNGTIDENGNFQLAGVSGRVFLQFSAAGWAIKSITVDGEDVNDDPIDLAGKPLVAGVVIRVTDKLTQISGQVSDSGGQRSRECTIVFQPAEPREPVVTARLMRVIRCDSTGSFQTRGMRPGRYLVTAVTLMEQGAQFEPEFQAQLRRAAESITIREGEMLTLDLKLTNGL